MKRGLLFVLFVISAFGLLSLKPGGDDASVSAHKLLNNMFESIGKVQTLYFQLNYQERDYENGKYHKDSSITKFQKQPKRVYMKMSSGLELLWGPDMNKGEALIHPNAFPYFNLNLNPNGNLMRKNQHHGIEDAGFDYFANLIKAEISKAGKDFDTHFFYRGEITYNCHKCQQLIIIDPNFKFVPYTVQKGENILTIAKKLCVNEYMTLKRNTKISSYTDVDEGQTILVPTNYGMEVILYVDETTLLPVMMRVDDDKGLFEKYDYPVFKLNPEFKSAEFTRDYKEYHF
jgi:hypothetical protein